MKGATRCTFVSLPVLTKSSRFRRRLCPNLPFRTGVSCSGCNCVEQTSPTGCCRRAAKSRRVRNMQRILQHIRLIRRIASALESGKTVPFLIPPNGERLAIVD
jgi:hypothetical protein